MKAEERIERMHSRTWALGAVVVMLLTIWALEGSVSSQDESPRSPATIRDLYDGDPSSRWLQAPVDNDPQEVTTSGAAWQDLASVLDWSRLSFYSYRDYNWNIYAVNPDGTKETRVTWHGAADHHPWLRTGAQRILFVSDRYGNDDIFVAYADGSDVQRLTSAREKDTMPTWTLDGSRIAFQSYRTGNSDVFVMNADGSALIQLTNSPAYDGHPSWSPDGTQIVFVSERDGGSNLWIMNADGSNQHQVTTLGTALYPAWSPLGNRIAYSADYNQNGYLETWHMKVDGTDPQKVYYPVAQYVDQWGPTWSPNGEWLALTETLWRNYEGQWYWYESNLHLIKLSDGKYITPVGDDRIWKAHWASTDMSPPGPCTLNAPSQSRSNSLILAWEAQDVGPAGIGGYDVQVRTSPTAPWQEFISWTRHPGGVYSGNNTGEIEFRCNAHDLGGNQANWNAAPVVSTFIDDSRPQSRVLPLPRIVRGSELPVRWLGTDLGSGIASYDVLVRDGADGDWHVWRTDMSDTSAQFNGSLGHTYYFRSQARDGIGHVEPWQPSPQAVTTLYSHILTGTITDQRGNTNVLAAIRLDPAPPFVSDDSAPGTYRFYLGNEPSHTLELTAEGFGILPATELHLDEDARFDFVLPPKDDVLVNGGFEAGALDGWSVAGERAETTFASRHTGTYGLHLAHSTAATTVLSQTLQVSETLHQPTFSLLYRMPSDLVDGMFSVRIISTESVTVVHTSAASQGWAHAWVDLTPYVGQRIDLYLELTGAAGAVDIDEASVGSWQTPLIDGVSPESWSGSQAPKLTIVGRNFSATDVFLGDIELTNITWVSATTLTADAPPDLPHGVYDLTVINPNGSATTLPDAITVTWNRAILPVVALAYQPPVWQSGADWPTLGHDLTHTGNNDADPGGSRYAPAWTVTLPFTGLLGFYHSTAVADGVLVAVNHYYSGNSAVVALEAETGVEMWRIVLPGYDGVSQPSIAHGAVYFQDNYNFFCVDLYTGVPYWKVQFPTIYGIPRFLSPVVTEEAVYTGGKDYSSGRIYAFDAGTGHEIWRTWMVNWDRWTPAYSGRTLYTWVAGVFRAHNLISGMTMWQIIVGDEACAYSMNTAPVIADQTAIIIGCSGLRAIDLRTQEVRWVVSRREGALQVPAVVDGVVYAPMQGGLEARRLSDGSLLWRFEGDGALGPGLVVAGDYVYVASGENTYVLNRHTHALEWQTDCGGSLNVANGFLYIAPTDQTVHAFRAQDP